MGLRDGALGAIFAASTPPASTIRLASAMPSHDARSCSSQTCPSQRTSGPRTQSTDPSLDTVSCQNHIQLKHETYQSPAVLEPAQSCPARKVRIPTALSLTRKRKKEDLHLSALETQSVHDQDPHSMQMCTPPEQTYPQTPQAICEIAVRPVLSRTISCGKPSASHTAEGGQKTQKTTHLHIHIRSRQLIKSLET